MIESPLPDNHSGPAQDVDERRALYASSLARDFIRTGRGFGELADLIKVELCAAAATHIKEKGGRVTTSRIALLTGLSRANVAQIRRVTTPSRGAIYHRPRHNRVIEGWKSDPQYLDASGRPAPLAKTGGRSFASLCKKYSGDIPPRAILDELVASGLAVVSKEKRIALV